MRWCSGACVRRCPAEFIHPCPSLWSHGCAHPPVRVSGSECESACRRPQAGVTCGCLCTQLDVPDVGTPGGLPDPRPHLFPECSPLQLSLGWAWLPCHPQTQDLPVSPGCLFLQVALSLRKPLNLPGPSHPPVPAPPSEPRARICPESRPLQHWGLWPSLSCPLCFWCFPPYSVSLPPFPWLCFCHSASAHLSLLGSPSVTSPPIHLSLLLPSFFTTCRCIPPSPTPWL